MSSDDNPPAVLLENVYHRKLWKEILILLEQKKGCGWYLLRLARHVSASSSQNILNNISISHNVLLWVPLPSCPLTQELVDRTKQKFPPRSVRAVSKLTWSLSHAGVWQMSKLEFPPFYCMRKSAILYEYDIDKSIDSTIYTAAYLVSSRTQKKFICLPLLEISQSFN